MAAIVPQRREKNGRKQRPTMQQLAAADRDQRMAETFHAHRQPHRRDLPDPGTPMAFSALGRLCARMKWRQEYFIAGEMYGTACDDWRIAKGLPPRRPTDKRVQATKPDLDRLGKLQEKMLNAQQAMRYASFLVLETLIGDDEEIGMDQVGRAEDGLHALAIHYGLLKPY